MGEVYRARDSRLDRDVAIKVLPERLARDPQALGRFEREAKAVAALSHPNILAIHDFGRDGAVTYAVTELLEGETLRARLARGALPWRKAVETGIAIADGLSAAHSKGIVHRDLKPENLFLTQDGRVKILDFGLARGTSTSAAESAEAATVTEEGVTLGTVGYMSPEQVRGTPADARSDIFSLGCVLYEMVAARRAFSRETAAQTMAAILEAQPRDLSSTGREIPAAFENVIAHCLEKNPPERFHSAHDLALALHATLSSPADAPRSPARRWAIPAVCLAALLLTAAVYWFAVRPKPIDSLAVLPFVNVGGDPNAEYLSDGITESLINNLSQLPKLRVVPRTLVEAYKGKQADPRKLGQELHVRAILTGKVVHRGDSLHVQTELVDCDLLSQLWGDQYDRKFSEILAVQEEIARQVSEKLRLRPTGEQQKQLARRSTQNTEAYQLYLRGRYEWNRRTAARLKTAVDYFRQAIEKDPGYSLAYGGLAQSYALFNIYDVEKAADSCPKAKDAAARALQIDSNLVEPHAALVWIKLSCDWDWAGSEAEFKRSVQIDPNDGVLRGFHAAYLKAMGRLDDAVAETKRGSELEPLSLNLASLYGRELYFAGRYDEALVQLRKALDMDSTFGDGLMYLGWVYERKHMFDEAIRTLQEAIKVSGGDPRCVSSLGHVYAISGKRKLAEEQLELLKAAQRYVGTYEIAVVYAGLGNKDEAFRWLEASYREKYLWILWLRIDPRLENLRGDPRFADIVRRVGLP
jgi:TolB-like protein/tRNA A-37 threonylcarbamoyl transferase component Bud32/Tfp pilus assembly protein PilF